MGKTLSREGGRPGESRAPSDRGGDRLHHAPGLGSGTRGEEASCSSSFQEDSGVRCRGSQSAGAALGVPPTLGSPHWVALVSVPWKQQLAEGATEGQMARLGEPLNEGGVGLPRCEPLGTDWGVGKPAPEVKAGTPTPTPCNIASRWAAGRSPASRWAAGWLRAGAEACACMRARPLPLPVTASALSFPPPPPSPSMRETEARGL